MAVFILGQDEVVTLNCSATGNPLPLLGWSRDGVPVDGVQAATGFMETAFSTLTVNITELGVGTHNLQCTATVDTPTTQSESSSAMATITVEAVLRNINVVPESQTFVLENNPNVSTTLNCFVEASPPPRNEWSRNGEAVQGEPVSQTGDLQFFSTLTLTFGELGAGVHTITCSAFQNAETPPTMITDTATVSIHSKLTIIFMHCVVVQYTK